LPPALQAGRENGPELGRATVHVSTPGVRDVVSYVTGETGVKYVTVWEAESNLPAPIWREPWKSGRQGPVSLIAAHSDPLRFAVKGRPLLQISVLPSCQPPTIALRAPPPPANFWPLPNGKS